MSKSDNIRIQTPSHPYLQHCLCREGNSEQRAVTPAEPDRQLRLILS